jgi:APA family basic amino acid/polyamine antiporter
LLPQFFSALQSRSQTPVNAIVICGVIMATLAGVAPLTATAQLVNAGTLAEFVLVCAGVIVLRRRTDIVRPFRTPGGILIPLLGIVSCTALLNFLPVVTLTRYAAWLALGFALYFVFAARRSTRRALGENPL